MYRIYIELPDIIESCTVNVSSISKFQSVVSAMLYFFISMEIEEPLQLRVKPAMTVFAGTSPFIVHFISYKGEPPAKCFAG